MIESVTENILDELTWRGLIAQSTDLDALRKDLEAGPVTLYAGFDPTGPSLHAGHLVPLLALKRFQRAGNRPIVLAGGATGLIGDPRDVGERTMNSADTVADWAGRIRGQLERFVDFDDSPTSAVIENNMNWTGKMSAIDFLRDVGKHFSVNVMLARDTVKRRLESDGMSYTEFSYMLLQANDYLHLRRDLGCTLQVGGSDQWGNIIAGVELNRRVDGESVHAMTVPLVTSADGKKFGKSTGGGSLWLDPEMTSPYAWYQYFVNTGDADVIKYLRWFTFLTADELAELETATAERPHAREAQKRLAAEMTTLGSRRTQHPCCRARQPGVVRQGGAGGTRRVDARRGAERSIGQRIGAGGAAHDHRSARDERLVREQGGRSTRRERGRCFGEQPEGVGRRLGAHRIRFCFTAAGWSSGAESATSPA